jgi:hypothetical protein
MILEQAQRDYSGSLTEEELRSLRAQFRRLDEQIQSEVPKRARRLYAEHQLRAVAESLEDLYKQYQSLSNEAATPVRGLAPDLEAAIRKEIVPGYKLRQRQQRIIIAFTLLTCLVVVTPLILTYYDNALGLAIAGSIHGDEVTYARANLLYVVVLACAVYLIYRIPKSAVRRVILSNRILTLAVAVLAFMGWAFSVLAVQLDYWYNGVPSLNAFLKSIPGAILSAVAFAVSVRVIHLLLRSTKLGSQLLDRILISFRGSKGSKV